MKKRNILLLLPVVAIALAMSPGAAKATLSNVSNNSGSNSSGNSWGSGSSNGGDHSGDNGGDSGGDHSGGNGGDCNGGSNPPPAIPEANAILPVLALLVAAGATELWRRRSIA